MGREAFLQLAESHPAAGLAGLSGVFGVLREQFIYARKPLIFIASQYLHSSRPIFLGIYLNSLNNLILFIGSLSPI
ncbi:MAG: hypothetical protein CM1200mP22_31660 [Dehalococcoidia bacterium]|nr:MAG: hypothetical protein CM1200mP22_31660 [Dehalococcoidia bacterium]